MDSTFFETLLNFAFTDFDTGIKSAVTEDGCTHSDTEAMTVRIQRSIDGGIPLLDGAQLARITRTYHSHGSRDDLRWRYEDADAR